ncbi:LysE family translocator [Gordonia sp. N1V]|uniref:LysE family translocator n=1 Tax=Gordonia sp. N1V TaxID=3034163 RepID=UPI0023E233B0|nr:LysE family translocator [Gordonia sp. N1V]MDF3281375.1 LysE family translocator [Gordonia sp. N1V]
MVAAVILVIVPGPDMILIVTLGSRRGPKAGVAAAAGVAAGLTVHIVIAVVGLAAVLHRFPAVYEVLRWAGVGYLLYLAWSTWRAGDATAEEADQVEQVEVNRPVLSAFRSATITNVLNPKVILFNVAFLPQFASPELGHMPLQLAVLGAVLVVIDFAIDGPIGYFAGTLGKRIRTASKTSTRRVNRSAAAIFVGLAGWLAATS